MPPSIRIAPVRKADIEAGNDLMLVCYASGDPKPTITWTKESVSVKEFNASGQFLHLANIHRKNAGPYRCTASNGYGNNVTSVSIVSIKCKYLISSRYLNEQLFLLHRKMSLFLFSSLFVVIKALF